VAVISIVINYYLTDFIISSKAHEAEPEINAWLVFVTGAATVALAIVAWYEIRIINNQSDKDFLLHIDERWGSVEVIRARKIIHELYIQIREKHKEDLKELPEKSDTDYSSIKYLKAKQIINDYYQPYPNLPLPLSIETKDNFVQAVLGLEIFKISKDRIYAEEFVYLLNFLDFMETIAYLARGNTQDNELVNKINDLCGGSLIFNYNIFKPYMEIKRKKHPDEKFYVHFDELYDALMEIKKLKEKT